MGTRTASEGDRRRKVSGLEQDLRGGSRQNQGMGELKGCWSNFRSPPKVLGSLMGVGCWAGKLPSSYVCPSFLLL